MKLTDATELMKLQQRVVGKDTLPAIDVAKRVFVISAAFGEPYEVTPQVWAKMWLASRKFHLAEIAPHQVAVPYANRISAEKVRRAISASADGEMEPIVIDINRQGIGKTVAGYTPKVIVVDGKHRHKAQLQMGKDKILAWVGDLALAELQRRQEVGKRFVIQAAATTTTGEKMSNLLVSASIYAAVAVKPSSAIPRQDTGDGGSRPTGGTRMNSAAGGGMGGSLGGGSGSNPATMRVQSQGARSSGSLEEADPSDTKVSPDPSDTGAAVDPSDRQNWNSDKAQLCAPGCTKNHDHNFADSSSAPGAGVGPRLKQDWGAKNSDFSKGSLKANRRLEAGPVKIQKIVTKKK